MPIGRPRIPGTEAERAEARRAKVRANVQAFRKRQKEKKLAEQAAPWRATEPCPIQPHCSHVGSSRPPTGLLASATVSNVHAQAEEISVFPPEDPAFWLWAIPAGIGAKLAGSAYQESFIQALQQRFVPARTFQEYTTDSLQKRYSICCSTWITSATLEVGRPETEVLMEALLAASLAIVGRDRNDPDMSIHGAYMQTRALQRLRYSLTRYQEGDKTICPTMLSLTALTCAMSELIANKSWENFNHHLLGVGALIFNGGVEGLASRSAREHFFGYRALQVPFLFRNRQRAFLSDPEWNRFPWRSELELAQHPLHTMLDIALKILPEIVKQDMPKQWKLAHLQERLDRAEMLVDELEGWEHEQRSRNNGILYTKIRSTWGAPYEYCLDFPAVSLAIAFTMYAAVRVHAATLVANISEEILSRAPAADVHPSEAVLEGLRWSRLSCQSLEYFHTGTTKAAGRVVTLWPLDTAWELFQRLQDEGLAEVYQERIWCRMTAERLSGLGIPPFQWR